MTVRRNLANAAKRLPERSDTELLLAWQRKTIRVANQRWLVR
jgi:hypothetical protein